MHLYRRIFLPYFLCEYLQFEAPGAVKYIIICLTVSVPTGLAVPIFAGHAQFFNKHSNLGFTLSTMRNDTSTDLLFQISAPQRAGWGAVGTGYRMDRSLMFIIYPSGQGNGGCVH